MAMLVHYEKKYPVVLTEAQREQPKSLIAACTAPVRKLTNTRILLKADQSTEEAGWMDEKVTEAVEGANRPWRERANNILLGPVCPARAFALCYSLVARVREAWATIRLLDACKTTKA